MDANLQSVVTQAVEQSNAFTIGIPSFILALEPNKERIKGIFIFNILRSSVPAGLTITIGIMICVIAQKLFGMSELDYTTLCVLSLTAGSMMILFKIRSFLSGHYRGRCCFGRNIDYIRRSA